MYSIEDGDTLKILPFIENGKLIWGKQYDIVGNNGGLVYDTNGYLRKMWFIHREKRSYDKDYKHINITKKTMLHVYVNGESKLIGVGRKIIDLATENKSTLFDLRCNDHILVSKDMVEVSGGMKLPSYDNCSVITKDWNAPVTDINSKEEWFEYLINNQPEPNPYDSKYDVLNQRDALIDLFGSDLLSEVIKIERNKKLETILNY